MIKYRTSKRKPKRKLHRKKSASKIGDKGFLRPKTERKAGKKTSPTEESMLKSTEFCGRYFGGSDLKNVITRQPLYRHSYGVVWYT